MKATLIAAFVCYSLFAVGWALIAIVYLVRSQFMTYHEQAVGLSWEKVDERTQVVILGLMRSAAGGVLAGSVGIAVLVLIPFRNGSLWAFYTIPAIGLVMSLPALYAQIVVKKRTRAHTPVTTTAASIGLIVLGIILSFV